MPDRGSRLRADFQVLIGDRDVAEPIVGASGDPWGYLCGITDNSLKILWQRRADVVDLTLGDMAAQDGGRCCDRPRGIFGVAEGSLVAMRSMNSDSLRYLTGVEVGSQPS